MGKITDDDLVEVEGKLGKFVGLLQHKYGYSKEKAEQEYNRFIGRFKD